MHHQWMKHFLLWLEQLLQRNYLVWVPYTVVRIIFHKLCWLSCFIFSGCGKGMQWFNCIQAFYGTNQIKIWRGYSPNCGTVVIVFVNGMNTSIALSLESTLKNLWVIFLVIGIYVVHYQFQNFIIKFFKI